MTATAAEAAHQAVMGALDHLIEMARLEILVGGDEKQGRPARQTFAILREIQDALDSDVRDGTTDGLQRLWGRLHSEDLPPTVISKGATR